MDCYSFGIRRLYPTQSDLLSVGCRVKIQHDFSMQLASTDIIERLNSELTAPVLRRAPARSFPNSARELFLRQLAVVHQHRGGQQPLKPQSFDRLREDEELHINPLVSFSELEDGARQGTVGDAADTRHRRSGAASSSSRGLHPGAAEGLCTALVPAGDRQFGNAIVARRPDPCAIAPARPAQTAPKRGLSPYILELNKTMEEAKRLKGKPLTESDMAAIRANFKRLWDRGQVRVQGGIRKLANGRGWK